MAEPPPAKSRRFLRLHFRRRSLVDIILAEPGALIGFTGARVIQQTIGGKLPEASSVRSFS